MAGDVPPEAVREALLRAVARGRRRVIPHIVKKVAEGYQPAPIHDGLVVEELEYYVESGSQGWVPLRIVRPPDEPVGGPHPSGHAPSAQSSEVHGGHGGEGDGEPVGPEEGGAAGRRMHVVEPHGEAHGAQQQQRHQQQQQQLAEDVQEQGQGGKGQAAAAAGGGNGDVARIQGNEGSVAAAASEAVQEGQQEKGEGQQQEGQQVQEASSTPDLQATPSSANLDDGATASASNLAAMFPFLKRHEQQQQQRQGQQREVKRRPVVIFLHPTGQSMDAVRHRQELYARMGYLTAAIDSRYHGRRAVLPPELADHVSAAAAHASAAAVQPPAPAAATAVLHTLKGLDARLVSALEKADAAAGYSSWSSTSAMAAPLANPHGNTTADAATPDRTQRLHLDPHPLPPAPPEAWLGAIEELKKHHGAATAAAVLATLPPAPTPGAAGPAVRPPYSRSACTAPGAPGDKDTVRKLYETALVAAWRGSGERPVLLDSVWDVMHLVDVLLARADVDPERIGLTGVSLGGMITWLTAAADPRVTAAAPLIGVQSFAWALQHDAWHARVDSIPLVFKVAAADMGRKEVDAEVVRAVWDKLLPGVMSQWDAPQSLPCIAPRPLLIANGELDARCPLPGLMLSYNAVHATYAAWAREQRRAVREREWWAAKEAREKEKEVEAAGLVAERGAARDQGAAGEEGQDGAVERGVSGEARGVCGDGVPVVVSGVACDEGGKVEGLPAGAEEGAGQGEVGAAEEVGQEGVATGQEGWQQAEEEKGEEQEGPVDPDVAAAAAAAAAEAAAKRAAAARADVAAKEAVAAEAERAQQVAWVEYEEVRARAVEARAAAAVQEEEAGMVHDEALREEAMAGAEAAKEAAGAMEEEAEGKRTVGLLAKVAAAKAAAALEAARVEEEAAGEAEVAAAEKARAAAEAAQAEAEAVEALVGSRLRLVVDKGVGHEETGAMHRAVEQWFHTHLLWR